jgi:hypothetical protein
MLETYTYSTILHVDNDRSFILRPINIKVMYCSSINLTDEEAYYLYFIIHNYIILNDDFEKDNQFIDRLYGELTDFANYADKKRPDNFLIVILFDEDRNHPIGFVVTYDHIEPRRLNIIIRDTPEERHQIIQMYGQQWYEQNIYFVDITNAILLSNRYQGLGLCKELYGTYLHLLKEIYSRVIGVRALQIKVNDISAHNVYRSCYRPSFLENDYILVSESKDTAIFRYDIAKSLLKYPIPKIYELEPEHEFEYSDDEDDDEDDEDEDEDDDEEDEDEDEDEEDDSEYSYERR